MAHDESSIGRRDLVLLALFVVIACAAAAITFVVGEAGRRRAAATPVAAITPGPAFSPAPTASAAPLLTPQAGLVASVTPTAGLTPTATPCLPPAGWVPYTVQPGETLTRIAAWYGLAAADLAQANCLASADLIQAGQIVHVPYLVTPTPTPCAPPAGWVLYVVQPGETLFRIALQYGLTAAQLQAANCLASADTLQAGQSLYVPYLIAPTAAIVPTVAAAPTAVVPPAATVAQGVGPGPTAVPVPGLLETLFFNPGGAPAAAECAAPLPGSQLQVTFSERFLDRYQMCVHGFPLSETITVELSAPGLGPVARGVFTASLGTDGRSLAEIPIWMPVGLPAGTWTAAVQAAAGQVTQTWTVTPFPGPALNTFPQGAIDLLGQTERCTVHARNTRVIIRGLNFDPGVRLLLGIYTITGEDPLQGPIASWVQTLVVETDGQGGFSTDLLISPSDPGNTYWVIPVTDLSQDFYDASLEPDAIKCYEVR